jgi:hypothetical protein
MGMTPDQETRIRLLSDGELYRTALDFAREQQEVIAYSQFNSQVNGLQEYARSWKELDQFVGHQKDRNWEGQNQSYQGFYTALHTFLNQLRHDVKEKYHFVPDGLTKKETKALIDFFAGRLAREFVQHLAAEMMWQKETQS